jgi:hypothetical protein
MKHTDKKSANRRPDIAKMSIIANGRGHKGMDIYLKDQDGHTYYLMPHRYNEALFFHLRDGARIEALRSIKPQRSSYVQRLLHSLGHVLRVAESFVRYELDDAA